MEHAMNAITGQIVNELRGRSTNGDRIERHVEYWPPTGRTVLRYVLETDTYYHQQHHLTIAALAGTKWNHLATIAAQELQTFQPAPIPSPEAIEADMRTAERIAARLLGLTIARPMEYPEP